MPAIRKFSRGRARFNPLEAAKVASKPESSQPASQAVPSDGHQPPATSERTTMTTPALLRRSWNFVRGRRTEEFVQRGLDVSNLLHSIGSAMNYEMITIAAASAGQLFDIVNSVQSNRDQCLQLLERVHQIVNTLVNICGDAQKHSVVMNPLMETAVDQFIQTLTTLHGILLSLSSVSLFGRILKHLETRSQLTDCDEALRQALDVFNVQSDLITHSMLGSARTAAKTRHEELLRVLKPEPAVFKPPR